MTFTLPPLPYASNALEPYIDQTTVELHYGKHHQTYCDKLNAGIAGTEYETLSLEELVSKLNELPENLKPIVRNHGGGLLNHNIYWETMVGGGRAMSASLQNMLEQSFGSADEFKKQFIASATSLFGSGRTWLEFDVGKLQITNYPNQENPLMVGEKPIVGVDVWEHAYYLKCQNRRAEYLENRWSLVDWEKVELRIKN